MGFLLNRAAGSFCRQRQAQGLSWAIVPAELRTGSAVQEAKVCSLAVRGEIPLLRSVMVQSLL